MTGLFGALALDEVICLSASWSSSFKFLRVCQYHRQLLKMQGLLLLA